MTTAPDMGEPELLEQQISENINTLMHRARLTGRRLAAALGFSQATFARKLAHSGSWSYVEVAAIAKFFEVSTDELATDLPSRSEWQARSGVRAWRDSNPQPSDLYPARHLYVVPPVQPTLTLVGRAS